MIGGSTRMIYISGRAYNKLRMPCITIGMVVSCAIHRQAKHLAYVFSGDSIGTRLRCFVSRACFTHVIYGLVTPD
jgi:hypothetical protein